MDPPVSEVAIIPLVKGTDPRDENSKAAKILHSVIQLATEQPGYQRMVWGLDEKDPTVLVMIVDWDDLESHLNYMADPCYKPIMDEFNMIIDGTAVLFHTTYEEGIGIVPLVEFNDYTADVFIAFFPARFLTQDFQEEFCQVSRDVNTNLLVFNDAPSSIASGWCTDDMLYKERHGKGPERAWILMVTWKNTETRQRAWDRKAVLGDIPKLVQGHGELQIYKVEFHPTTQGPLKDVFGEYTIVREKFNGRPSTKRNWYCKHQYTREDGNDSYRYVHLDGRYHSTNPDGTRASVTHEAVGKFMQEMKSRKEKTIKNDQTEKRKICARMLKGKEAEHMGTDDEAEETEYETEEVSDEERATKKNKKRKEKKQRKDGEEDHTPEGLAAQRKTPIPEEQMPRAVTPMSELTSNNQSIDESTHLGETEGTSSQKRKANEMDDGEEQTARTPVVRKANMNKRHQPKLTAAERQERKRSANRRSRESAKRKKALARKQMEQRTSET
ncbi:hypothetical protein PENSOL_c026G07146 [Penicillium solitum]|uniref:ABM domain-containing protein n=1 Tax=Penicillium solitum TaxID=60172 RepID=A0A1V6QYQ0_9EURO|nr:uncharacterized protein PENSOL_c026G07146 [Penicillium solitum]OQD94313.1 hypothetical protein PENSOL_c026G07146 [Penicillium solitum]